MLPSLEEAQELTEKLNVEQHSQVNCNLVQFGAIWCNLESRDEDKAHFALANMRMQ